MKRKTKKSRNKKSSKVKSRLLGAALVTTLLIAGTTSQSSALELQKIVGDLRKGADSLLYQFKNNPTVSNILGSLNQITDIFSSEIQRFTNISNADLNKIKGVLGVLAPSETKKAIEKQQDANTSIPGISSDNQASLGATTAAASSTLSLEGQKIDKQSLEEISKLVKTSEGLASDSADSADEAQKASSSQDILKMLANQSSNQAAINTANLRLLALQNNNLQAIKAQLAINNQANASFEGRQQSEAQQKALKEREKALAILIQNQKRYRF